MSKKRFGLLGKNISYSFSKGYFTEKFSTEELADCTYENFDIPVINDFVTLIKEKHQEIYGMNVTIPYKEAVMPFLDKLSKKAALIGAVNTIKFTRKGLLKGYNTDYYGFKKALKPLLQPHHKKALILGTGGASKGVAYALDELDIRYHFVSRIPNEYSISYDQINADTFDEYQIIINSTPVGTSPNIEDAPLLPYEFFTEQHIAFDLIYNPAETAFLKKAKAQGAQIKNGLEMLVFQAEKSWEIWNR
ncbi:shikimate dehydrogenase [Flavobacterium sp. K5-23]|uniref:shikimate dehydrogenase family protein n=1 Tax=Flavobacterium sp. K5-23 TaxID=2746225 RepID=UPI00200F16B3|nr:shikimate dehydrogenase [Flavobacterium sp. K5-23]UQD57374.1 shikimate dehydrogenase [Flavobacterium sp. K5-23]